MFLGEVVKRRKIDLPGPTLDHFCVLLPIDKIGNQFGEFPVQQLAHRAVFHGQMVVLVNTAPADQETVEIRIAFAQKLQHIKHKQSAPREPATDQPVEIIGFQSVSGKVTDPLLAVITVRRLEVSAGNGTSDLFFGHSSLRLIAMHRMIPEK